MSEYTPEEYEQMRLESALADASAEEAARNVLAAVQTAQPVVRQIIEDLQLEKARCQAVLDKQNTQIGPSDTKDAARAARRIADATIDLARVVKAMVDGVVGAKRA